MSRNSKKNLVIIQNVKNCYYNGSRVMWSLWDKEKLINNISWINIYKVIHYFKVSSRDLVVKAEDSWPRGLGFKPPLWRPFFQAPFIWIKAWNKNCGKPLTWHCCMCCNPANGMVDFEEWSVYKIQLHGIEWIVSLWAD